MEKIDTHQLLTIRLGAIHGLLIEMLEIFLGWMTDGAAKRYALEHKSEQVMFTDMELFYQLSLLIQDFGDTLAWLENPHLEPLPALEEMYSFSGARDDNPVVNGPDFPKTGIEFLDEFLYLVINMSKLDSFTKKLISDAEEGRFKNTSEYDPKDLPIFNTELLINAVDVMEQFQSVRKIVFPGSETELRAEMKDFMQNRLKFQEDELSRLLPFVPDESEVESVESCKLDEERGKEFVASWYGAKSEFAPMGHPTS